MLLFSLEYLLLRMKMSQHPPQPAMPQNWRLAVFFCGLHEPVLGGELEVWDPSVTFPSLEGSTKPFIFSGLCTILVPSTVTLLNYYTGSPTPALSGFTEKLVGRGAISRFGKCYSSFRERLKPSALSLGPGPANSKGNICASSQPFCLVSTALPANNRQIK